MHWSRPAAMRFLEAMRRFGWEATTEQLAQEMKSLAVHSDAASARCLFEELGVEDPQGAVTARYERTTPAGRKVYVYRLRTDVIGTSRNLVLFRRTDPAPDAKPMQAALF